MSVRRIGLVIATVVVAATVSASMVKGEAAGTAPPDVVARGKYLAQAADCGACHTAPGGAPFAGGLPLNSGFGTIYATNITPDPDGGGSIQDRGVLMRSR